MVESIRKGTESSMKLSVESTVKYGRYMPVVFLEYSFVEHEQLLILFDHERYWSQLLATDTL